MELIVLLGAILILILWANIAETRAHLRPVFLISLLFLNSLVGLLGLAVLSLRLIDLPGPISRLPPGVAITFLSASLFGFLVLIPGLRRKLALVLPIRPDSLVHLTALSLSVYLLAWDLLNLILAGGVEGIQDSAEKVTLGLLVIQAVGLVSFAFAGVGFPIRRSWKEVSDRLGFKQFNKKALLGVAGAIAGLVLINFVVSIIWLILDPKQAEAMDQISELMWADYDSLGAIFLLAVLSSVSEEILFRGAVQPRLGLVFTSVLFAFTHLQYAVSPATLVVLLIGLVLGLLRRRFGTWAAVLAHFGYNFGLLLMGLIANRFFETLG